MAGAIVGALWAWLAPPIHGVVALTRSGDRIKAYLGTESDHLFTAAFLMVGMLARAGGGRRRSWCGSGVLTADR